MCLCLCLCVCVCVCVCARARECVRTWQRKPRLQGPTTSARQLTHNKLVESMFAEYDVDGSGSLSLDEVRGARAQCPCSCARACACLDIFLNSGHRSMQVRTFLQEASQSGLRPSTDELQWLMTGIHSICARACACACVHALLRACVGAGGRRTLSLSNVCQ